MGSMINEQCNAGLWMYFLVLFWTLIVISIILLVVWVARQTGRRNVGHAEETALDILKKRYAGGEITKEEYEKIKKDIS
jgi:putative membrane protein